MITMDNPIKLYCFPYAGGNVIGTYFKWKKYLPENIELMLIELAGRGIRSAEKSYDSLDETIEDLFGKIKNDIMTGKYAFFGHSMGALIALKLALKLKKENFTPPAHIFFSGEGAPHECADKKKYHLMPDEVFDKEVLNLGGTPKEFFELPELKDFLLPVLKNDFRLSETATFDLSYLPLHTSISVLAGKEEELTPVQVVAWNKYTSETCHIHYFNGGHFFINDHLPDIVKIVATTLNDPAEAL